MASTACHSNGKVNGMVAHNNTSRTHHQEPDHEENKSSPLSDNGRRHQHSNSDEEFDSDMLREEQQLARIQFQIRQEVNGEK
ncbi:predicted protein [Pyrenophora tritici-repentis Pt-1C-BFP]|uniref:Uncharacterized protein n=1 Tax=Pyrenophora tritici-repentis (strain Pt-1C-BFP) TaxID=426418 RepID=B2W0C4_PYRTR|nr:uncharacterized protein PTRG_03909 [Pyrenophora tritici-repentis Pt-1C-BFP]EDU46747.1 predicted protein [Pyrenophora tritici-repentis Pt-1C-BFP]